MNVIWNSKNTVTGNKYTLDILQFAIFAQAAAKPTRVHQVAREAKCSFDVFYNQSVLTLGTRRSRGQFLIGQIWYWFGHSMEQSNDWRKF